MRCTSGPGFCSSCEVDRGSAGVLPLRHRDRRKCRRSPPCKSGKRTGQGRDICGLHRAARGRSHEELRATRSPLPATLEMGLERGDAVIALGGGVIGDLAGFAASIVRRGMRCVQIPTTLLAQVNSSVGGKTGINTPQGKNLIGTFHQPSLVLADTEVLTTLPVRQMRAGYAEVAKYGLLGDAEFFAWLEESWRRCSSTSRRP